MRGLANSYTRSSGRVRLDVVGKTRAELQQLLSAENVAFPDLLWAAQDFIPLSIQSNNLLELEELFEMSDYLGAAVMAGTIEEHTWGAPVGGDNFLLLYYNKQFVPNAPANTLELETVARAAQFVFPELEESPILTSLTESATTEAPAADGEAAPQNGEVITNGIAGLVFPQHEPLWLVPWLHGFGGELFETGAFSSTISTLPPLSDRVTARFPHWMNTLNPTLNTPEMLETLRLLHSWKFDQRIVPDIQSYEAANRLFLEGRAAMIINSNRSLNDYAEALGDDLGIAPLPQVVEGSLPRPYSSFTYLMIGREMPAENVDLARGFIEFATNLENQTALTQQTTSLPLTIAALSDSRITEDAWLQAQAKQLRVTVPFPSSAEIRCFWDAMRPELFAVFENIKTPERAALTMQQATEACLDFMRQDGND